MKHKLPTIRQINSIPFLEVEQGKVARKIKVSTLSFINFLAEIYFCYIIYNGVYQLARIIDNIVYVIEDKAQVIEAAKQWLNENAVDGKIAGVYVDQVLNAWINKTPQLLAPLNLKFLPIVEIKQHFDNKNECYLYFTNTVVKITKTNFELLPYNQLDGHVFSEQIINREFHPKKVRKQFRRHNYAKFLYNIAGQNIKRAKAFVSIIGYMLHRYKSSATTKAIILLDGVVNELNTCMGGSGKGVFTSFFQYFTNVCEIAGKDFSSSYAFAFQRVSQFTNIIAINDILSSLNLEGFYGRLTDVFTINIKFKPEIEIPFERSPKFIMTSNYIPKAPEGFSTERRKYELELSTHYGESLTPAQEFNQQFYDDWDDFDWNEVTLLAIFCIQYYLNHGLVEAPQINIAKRRLLREVGPELLDFLDEKFSLKKKYHKKELFKEFITGGYIDSRFKPTQRTFTIKLKKYCEFNNLLYKETPSNTKAYIEIISEEEQQDFITINDVDTHYKTVDTVNKMTRLANKLQKHFEKPENNTIAIDLETTGLDCFEDDIVCMALTFEKHTGYNIIFPKNKAKIKSFLAPILPFLQDEKITKVFHNAKFDLKFLDRYQIEVALPIEDTMILDHFLDPNRKIHGLKQISELHLGYQQINFKQLLGDQDITEVPVKELTKYACEDTDLTFQLYNYITNQLKQNNNE